MIYVQYFSNSINILQEPYTQLASVGPFVENTTRELNSLYNNTIEKKFSKEAKDKMEYVGTLTSTAGQFADKDQFDQAIGKIEEARDAINVLRQVIHFTFQLLRVN